METSFRVFGCYRWLVKKAFDLVAIDHLSNPLAASSIAEAFYVLYVLYLTPLIDVLDGFLCAILCHVPWLHKDVPRIISWILGQHSSTVACLIAESVDFRKKDQEPTKKVLRLASGCASVRSTLRGIHETSVHRSEATRKSFCTW